MYNLLREGITDKNVISLNNTRKLTIDGQTDFYQVYKIKLDLLYYNDKNGRISTWVSQYVSQHGHIDLSDKENYNNIIGGFVKESNPEAMNKTKNNIEAFGQQEPGVVLNDGRVIDGNRRFTCLRELAREDSKFGYFEAVILEYDEAKHSKHIKELELQLQHGKDKPVDYGAIERLVEVYQNTIDPKIFTNKEYAKYTNSKLTDVNNDMERATLMVEFLDFIKAPMQFHIARDLKIDGPINELNNILKGRNCPEDKELLKRTAFAYISMDPAGDITRYLRNFNKIIPHKEVYETFLEKQAPITIKVIDEIDSHETISDEIIRKDLRSNESLQEELRISLDEAVNKVDSINTKNTPLRQMKEIRTIIDGIDINIVKNLKDEQSDMLGSEITEIEKKMSDIRGALNAQRPDP